MFFQNLQLFMVLNKNCFFQDKKEPRMLSLNLKEEALNNKVIINYKLI